MSLLERWQGRRYRRRYGLRSRNGALEAALAARRERLACPCGGDQRGGDGCTCDPPFNR